MSTARPMAHERRVAVYTRHRAQPSPRQRRRARRKRNRATAQVLRGGES